MEKKRIITKNRFDMDIVCCCASCKFKIAHKEHTRKCFIDKREVTPDYLCTAWKIHPKLENAGSGGGSVKKKEYLMYIHRVGGWTEERQHEWEKIHGSRFAITY